MRVGVILFAAVMASAPAHAQRLTSEVDPFIGTGGHGHTYPGPSLPFGMIQPGPDTRLTGWDGCSGYHYSDSRVYGFSHTHLSGTGISDYGDVLLMPTTGEVRLNNGADGRPGYSSAFSHSEELAHPGYYAVTLRDYGIRAELTSTLRAGMHRYAFPAGVPANVILDLEHRDRLTEAAIMVVNDREVAGVRRSSAWARDQVVYYVIRFSKPFRTESGKNATKQAFRFATDAGTLLVKVGISAVSVEGARKNLEAEISGWDFDAVRKAADEAWERELSKIRIEGGTPAQRRIFYTALYHSMLAPNVYMDVDGQYRGRDFKIHKAEGFTYYTVFSLWDTFRALHPLLTIIDRARTRDFIHTFLRQYVEGGRLPVWELAANETDTMIGYHAVPVIADAVVKGIDGFDMRLAFQAMTHSAEEDRFGLRAYKTKGYIDGSDEAEGVSRTLEYAYDDWAIAQVAKRLKSSEYERYIRRSQSYRHLFDPSTGFMRPRVEGFWLTPFEPREVNNHYTEGNAWHYSFFVPHDIHGLIELMGGREKFTEKVDGLFSADSQTTGREQADITGMIGQYAHGNEPSHHMAYLYAYADQPWKTQAMVRRILDTLYADDPEGLSGNEDCGQMSAWYVFSALGFYPVTPGAPEYVIGSPLFPEATLHLENGRQFTIRANGVSPESKYIRSARLNGSAHDSAMLDHGSVAAGGELLFEMDPHPNRAWGLISGSSRSDGTATPVVAAPFVASGSRTFRGSQEITLGVADKAAVIHYTTDGSPPTQRSTPYQSPVNLTDSAILTAVAFRSGLASPSLSVAFRKLADYPRVTLSARYAPQYAAAGDDTLIDGLRGNNSFKTGRWQGYLGTDLIVTLDFGTPREIRSVAMGFLQDTGSWIFMPRRIYVELSDDGTGFTSAGSASAAVPETESKPTISDFAVDLATGRRARYLRIRVERYGKLPAWHAGAGNEAWFFTDEIVVR